MKLKHLFEIEQQAEPVVSKLSQDLAAKAKGAAEGALEGPNAIGKSKGKGAKAISIADYTRYLKSKDPAFTGDLKAYASKAKDVDRKVINGILSNPNALAYQEIAKQVAARPSPDVGFVNRTMDQVRAKYDIDDEKAADLYNELENIPDFNLWRQGKRK